jgi:hypothetical protein
MLVAVPILVYYGWGYSLAHCVKLVGWPAVAVVRYLVAM